MRIIITTEGGVINNVTRIYQKNDDEKLLAATVSIEVHDYDVEEIAEGVDDVVIDPDGDEYLLTNW